MALKQLHSSPRREYLSFVGNISALAFLFLLLLVATVGISYLADFLLRSGDSPHFAAYALGLFKYLLLVIDVIVFVASVASQTVRTVRRLRRIGEST